MVLWNLTGNEREYIFSFLENFPLFHIRILEYVCARVVSLDILSVVIFAIFASQKFELERFLHESEETVNDFFVFWDLMYFSSGQTGFLYINISLL